MQPFASARNVEPNSPSEQIDNKQQYDQIDGAYE